MEYLTDIVGDEYKQWEKGDRILLYAQTGSGKTTFILRQLLRYVVEKYAEAQEKIIKRSSIFGGGEVELIRPAQKLSKMIYFCNRTALYNQIADEANKAFENALTDVYEENDTRIPQMTDVFDMYTYQSLEAESLPQFFDRPDLDTLYIVFDELHYISDDATFNSNTIKWQKMFAQTKEKKNTISIYITATPEEVLYLLDGNRITESILSLNNDGGNQVYENYLKYHQFEKNDDIRHAENKRLKHLVSSINE